MIMGGIRMYSEGNTYKDNKGRRYTLYGKQNGDKEKVYITPKTSGRIMKNGEHTAKRPDGTTVRYRTNEGKVTGIYDAHGHLQSVLNRSGNNVSGQLDGRSFARSIQSGRTTYRAGNSNNAVTMPKGGIGSNTKLSNKIKRAAEERRVKVVKPVTTNEPKTTGGRKR